MSIAQFMELDPVRFSRLKLMAKSPLHYLSQNVEETAAMERGTATHSLVLGGKRVIAYPGATRRGKEWEAFEAANQDAEILTKNDYELAHAMAESVKRNQQAMAVLAGQRELEVAWQMMGRSCGSRLDVLGTGGAWVTDLKTCTVGDPARFMWQALRMNYHAQLAFYMEAARAAGLGDPQAAYVVAVESTAPHVVTTMRLSDRALARGRQLCALWLEKVLACEAAMAWPGYADGIVELDVPDNGPAGEDAA